MPPWAYALLDCSIVSLVITNSDSRGSISIAARSPAIPPPMISTSAKWCGIRLG